MSLSDKQSNGIDVRIEGSGPHLFGAADYRRWIEEEIRGAVKAVLEEILEAEDSPPTSAPPPGSAPSAERATATAATRGG